MVLIHNYQVDSVKDMLLHVDFLAVKSDEEVEAEVKVVLT
jgi:large subunit ribosomal protein L25